MTTETDLLSPENHAKSVLRLREDAQRLLEEARAKGERKDARSLEAQLRNVPDVRPDKIPGSLIKSEYAGASAAGCAGLPQILKKSVLDQLSDEPCHCRYAGVEFLAEFRDAEIPVVYAKTEDPLLHNGSLALDVVKE